MHLVVDVLSVKSMVWAKWPVMTALLQHTYSIVQHLHIVRELKIGLILVLRRQCKCKLNSFNKSVKTQVLRCKQALSKHH